MNVKSVVKVMNFHALLRVDRSRKQAEKYNAMQEELEGMMRIIMNNKNLILDKRLKLPDPNNPVLRIYVGSDLGFCGNINSSVSGMLKKDHSSQKIVIGKKLKKADNVIISLNGDAVRQDFEKVCGYLTAAVKEKKWSSVEVVYNHYYNVSSIKLTEKKLFPLDNLEGGTYDKKWEDFVVEGDITEILEEMMISYLIYEMKIVMVSAFAAENIMRQNATTESLNKLEEKEAEDLRVYRKERNQAAVSKSVDNYIKQKAFKKG